MEYSIPCLTVRTVFRWVGSSGACILLCRDLALLESVMYITGSSGGMVYSPMIKPRASAMFMQVGLVPQWLGRRQDRTRRGLAGLECQLQLLVSLLSLISGAMMLTLTDATPFCPRLPSMLMNTGRSC